MPHQPRISDLEQWPHCPQCHAPRTTQCPICETAGTDFLPVDPEYAASPDGGSDALATSCDCGTGGNCSEPCPPAQDAEPSGAERDEVFMVICPTCDEPFVPRHPNRCQWCGHRFPDGYTVDVDEDAPEQFNSRVIGAMVGLGALLLAVAIYFATMF
ncbi:MAG: hypothetical protein GXY83_24850 [Rhodopirellula sp.]|nr:hypothetical protein [Rhodopirellula sp.]